MKVNFIFHFSKPPQVSTRPTIVVVDFVVRYCCFPLWVSVSRVRSHLQKFSKIFTKKKTTKKIMELPFYLFVCYRGNGSLNPSFSSPPLPKTKQNKTTPVDRATLPSHPLPFSFWEKLHSHTTLLLICREVLVVVVPHAFYFSATNCVFRHCLASTIVKCPCLDI